MKTSPLLLALGTVLATLARGQSFPETIDLQAGETDRTHCPVVVKLPSGLPGSYALTTEQGPSLVLQVDAAGRGEFIEPHLAKGERRTYHLGKLEKTADDVAVATDGEVLKATFAGKPIFQYQMTPGPVPEGVDEVFRHGAHLHPIFSPSGKLVTNDHPKDHRWHRGIWLAWTHTEFEGRTPDFWNMGKDGGKLTGEVRFDRLDRSWSGPVSAGFASVHRFIDHTSGEEKDALNEKWEVRVWRPAEGANSYHAFDLTSTQTCAGTSPVKMPKYHYGGLGVRGNALWDPVDQVTMLTSNGDDRVRGDGTKAKWVYLGGDVDGQPTGMAVLIHPENFRFPQPLRLNPKNPQLCIAPAADGDWEIKPGDTYVSRYRIIVADGKPDAAMLDSLWADYATPPRAEVR